MHCALPSTSRPPHPAFPAALLPIGCACRRPPPARRLLLEACGSLRASLRSRGSDLLWVQGTPEAAVGRLVALAAAAGCSSVTLHHYLQPGAASAEVEDAVAAALAAAAQQHGDRQPLGRSARALLQAMHPQCHEMLSA
jgi:hypothetical protein